MNSQDMNPDLCSHFKDVKQQIPISETAASSLGNMLQKHENQEGDMQQGEEKGLDFKGPDAGRDLNLPLDGPNHMRQILRQRIDAIYLLLTHVKDQATDNGHDSQHGRSPEEAAAQVCKLPESQAHQLHAEQHDELKARVETGVDSQGTDGSSQGFSHVRRTLEHMIDRIARVLHHENLPTLCDSERQRALCSHVAKHQLCPEPHKKDEQRSEETGLVVAGPDLRRDLQELPEGASHARQNFRVNTEAIIVCGPVWEQHPDDSPDRCQWQSLHAELAQGSQLSKASACQHFPDHFDEDVEGRQDAALVFRGHNPGRHVNLLPGASRQWFIQVKMTSTWVTDGFSSILRQRDPLAGTSIEHQRHTCQVLLAMLCYLAEHRVHPLSPEHWIEVNQGRDRRGLSLERLDLVRDLVGMLRVSSLGSICVRMTLQEMIHALFWILHAKQLRPSVSPDRRHGDSGKELAHLRQLPEDTLYYHHPEELGIQKQRRDGTGGGFKDLEFGRGVEVMLEELRQGSQRVRKITVQMVDAMAPMFPNKDLLPYVNPDQCREISTKEWAPLYQLPQQMIYQLLPDIYEFTKHSEAMEQGIHATGLMLQGPALDRDFNVHADDTCPTRLPSEERAVFPPPSSDMLGVCLMKKTMKDAVGRAIRGSWLCSASRSTVRPPSSGQLSWLLAAHQTISPGAYFLGQCVFTYFKKKTDLKYNMTCLGTWALCP